MPITRVHHGTGSWEIDLDPAASAALEGTVKVDGHLIILPARILDPDQYTTANLLSQAYYIGIVQGWEPREDGPGWSRLFGTSLRGRLEDHAFGTERIYSAVGLSDLINKATATYGIIRSDAGAQTSVRAGTITDPGGVTFSGRFPAGMTAAVALDYVVGTYGQAAASAIEYLIHDNGPRAAAAGTTVGYMDVRPTATLFPTSATPTVLLAEKADTDGSYEGLEVQVVQGYRTGRVLPTDLWVLGEGLAVPVVGTTTIARPTDAETLGGIFGETLKRILTVSEPVTSATYATTRAQYLATFLTQPFSLYRVNLASVQVHHLAPGWLGPGDGCYLYLPSRGAEALTRTVTVGAQDYHPLLLRVSTLREPALPTYGYYYLSGAGVWTDITDAIVGEEQEAEVELVSTLRPLTAPDDAYSLQTSGATNTTTPNPPTSVTITAAAFYAEGGQQKRGAYDISWTNPTQNTDGTVIADGDGLRLRWRPRGSTAPYAHIIIPWGDTTARIDGVPFEDCLKTGVEFALRAEDTGTPRNLSSWATPANADLAPFAAGQTATGGHWNNTTDPLTIATFGTTYTDLASLAAGAYLKLDSEIVTCTARSGASATFSRASLGTTAAAHADGTTIYTGTIIDTVAPTAPPQPTLTDKGNSIIEVAINLSLGGWGAANTDVYALGIFYGATNPPPTTSWQHVAVNRDQLVQGLTITRTHKVPAASCGAAWYVGVKAVDCRGNLSGWSTISTLTPALIQTADVGAKQVTGPKIGGGTVAEDVDLVRGSTAGDAAIDRSANYDGSLDANGRLILTGAGAPTLGWAIDGAGNAAFNNILVRGTIYAQAGEITGTLAITGSGRLQIYASGIGAGIYMVMGYEATTYNRIRWTNLGSPETIYAYLQYDAGPALRLVNAAGRTYISGTTGVEIQRAGVTVLQAGVTAGQVDADRGDGTLTEIAPFGTLIAYGTFTATGLTYALTTSLADVTGLTTAVTVDYASEPVIVDVTVMVYFDTIAAGDWVRGQIKVEGTSRGVYMDQDTSNAAGTGATGSGGTGATGSGGTGSTSSTGSHSHSIPAMSVTGTSGAASAGTAHTHSSGSYGIPTATYTTGTTAAHSHTGPSHTHTGPSHTHGSAAITMTLRWVGAVTAGVDGQVDLTVQARAATAAGTISRGQIAYMIYRN